MVWIGHKVVHVTVDWPFEARLRDDITYRYVSYLYSELYIEEWMSSEYTSAESPMCIREGIRECN